MLKGAAMPRLLAAVGLAALFHAVLPPGGGPAQAMGKRPGDVPTGTGGGTAVMALEGEAAVPLPWIYASYAHPSYKIVAASVVRETFRDWVELPAEAHQFLLEAEVAKDAKPPFTKADLRRVRVARSWGPGRAMSTMTWDERNVPGVLDKLKWLGFQALGPERLATRLELPRGVLGARAIVLELDVDLKKAPPAE